MDDLNYEGLMHRFMGFLKLSKELLENHLEPNRLRVADTLDWVLGGLPVGHITNVTFSAKTWPYIPGRLMEKLDCPHVSKTPELEEVWEALRSERPLLVFNGWLTDGWVKLSEVAFRQLKKPTSAVLILTAEEQTNKYLKFYSHLRFHIDEDEQGLKVRCTKNTITGRQGLIRWLDANLSPLPADDDEGFCPNAEL